MSSVTLAVVVALYIGVTVFLAYYGYRRTKSNKDYLIAGGDAHPFLMALAYGSTFISTAAIIGFGGAASLYGMGLLWLVFANIFVGIFIAFVVYGKRTAIMGRELQVHTFPELLGKRFESDFLRRVTAGVIVAAMPLYAAAVMIGGARFIETTLHIQFSTAVWILALLVGAYVITGGLKGVLYTDALQGSIMMLGMVVLLVVTYAKLGGITAAHHALTDMAGLVPESLKAKGHLGWTAMPALGSELWWVAVSSLVLGVGIGVLAQPQLVVRFLTVKGPRELNRGVLIGGLFILGVIGSVYVVGPLTNVFFFEHGGKISLLAALDPATGKPNIDRVIPLYVNTAMPDWFSYLFMLTLLAAAMSTLSGQFHTIGTAASHDLYQRSNITVNRLGILVTLVITVILCFRLPGNIIAVATATFFGICAGAFLPAYTAALFWKRATKAGAVASLTVGLLASILAMTFLHAKEAVAFGVSQAVFGKATVMAFPWTVIDPICFSLPLSTLTLVVVSLLTQSSAACRPSLSKGQ
ncbi:MAG: sodium:solute symporter family protein [Bacillota bacterium]